VEKRLRFALLEKKGGWGVAFDVVSDVVSGSPGYIALRESRGELMASALK